ncbi:MAG TPA: hypothetical protein VM492_07030, partial [Sumerlaeia bacterium]|nr:hypothetical protein [Sumerlaeia bacterium]
TAHGDVYHGRHPDSGEANSNGAVSFSDGGGQVSMTGGGTGWDSNGDGWIDSQDTNWAAAAQDLWNAYLRDSADGVQKLAIPIPSVDDPINPFSPHDIIERADPAADTHSLTEEKFEYKAGLKIIATAAGVIPRSPYNGRQVLMGTDAAGNNVPLEYYIDHDDGDAIKWGLPPAGVNATEKSIVRVSQFQDAREAGRDDHDGTQFSIDVDLANMIESGIMPSNGILYVSNEDTAAGADDGVVRVLNGAEAPVAPGATGFTVATDDPVYIQGDFNTANQTESGPLCMVAGDAITILSNSWNDGVGYSIASETTVNAVCLGGIVASADGQYSGGVENSFRFLENWSGRAFNFSGSIVVLWESETATGKWKYGSPVYQAPSRKWAWDLRLGGVNGPPGAPRVVEMVRNEWEVVEN